MPRIEYKSYRHINKFTMCGKVIFIASQICFLTIYAISVSFRCFLCLPFSIRLPYSFTVAAQGETWGSTVPRPDLPLLVVTVLHGFWVRVPHARLVSLVKHEELRRSCSRTAAPVTTPASEDLAQSGRGTRRYSYFVYVFYCDNLFFQCFLLHD